MGHHAWLTLCILSARRAGALLWRVLFLAALWWLLSGDWSASWYIGLPSVLLALWLSLRLLPAGQLRFSPRGLLTYGLFFFVESVRGGLQVAHLALSPRSALRPALLDIRLRLPPGMGQVLLVNTLSLQPGTLVVDLSGTCLRLHVLDDRVATEAKVRRAEAHIARLLAGGGA